MDCIQKQDDSQICVFKTIYDPETTALIIWQEMFFMGAYMKLADRE